MNKYIWTLLIIPAFCVAETVTNAELKYLSEIYNETNLHFPVKMFKGADTTLHINSYSKDTSGTVNDTWDDYHHNVSKKNSPYVCSNFKHMLDWDNIDNITVHMIERDDQGNTAKYSFDCVYQGKKVASRSHRSKELYPVF